jgi:hypothetical protein
MSLRGYVGHAYRSSFAINPDVQLENLYVDS